MSQCKCPGAPRGQPPGMAADKCIMDLGDVLLLLLVVQYGLQNCDSRSFTIDYEKDCFPKDGEPFSLHSRELSLFSSSHFLLERHAHGLNTVQTYIA